MSGTFLYVTLLYKTESRELLYRARERGVNMVVHELINLFDRHDSGLWVISHPDSGILTRSEKVHLPAQRALGSAPVAARKDDSQDRFGRRDGRFIIGRYIQMNRLAADGIDRVNFRRPAQ